jgi:predicted CXXCH cytochrome family protein
MKEKGKAIGCIGLLSLAVLSSLVLAAPAHAKNEFKLKLGAKGHICLKCHEGFRETLKSRFLHPLVKKRECTGCHVPHASDHKGLLTAGSTQLCSNCHRKLSPKNALSTHEAVLQGNCKACHDSHGSNNRFILSKSGNELCLDCHKATAENVSKVRFKHESVEQAKGCLNCHDPHASTKSDHLLKTEVPALCHKCHETGKLTFRRTHMNYPVADSNCVSCHNPHGSNNRGIVFDVAHASVTERKCTACHQKATSLKTRRPATELCKGCHKKMVEQTFGQNRVHWPLLDNVGCLNCHEPHASKEQKLMKGPEISVCGECHSDTVELQELSKENPKNKNLCEPVKSGNCTTCHSPHASDNVLLVTQESISFDICAGCHNWEHHSTHPIGEKIIDQRNRNLRVDCLSCHSGCGTGNKPFMLPFNTTYELCVQCHVEEKR